MQVFTNELSQTSTVHLKEYAAILRRRVWTVLLIAAVSIVVGLVVNMRAKPVYEAEADLLVGGPAAASAGQVDANNPLGPIFAPAAPQTLSTQIGLLEDGPLIERAIASDGPASVDISAAGDTNIIQVVSEANDPKVAAAVPNTLLHLYIQDRAEKSLAEINSAVAFAQKQKNQAAEALIAANGALLRFQERNAIPGDLTASQSAQMGRVNEAISQQETLQKQLADNENEISRLEALEKSSPGVVDRQNQISNGTFAQIELALNQLKVQRTGMVQPGGLTPQAPKVIAIDAQIAAYEQQLAQQPKAIDILRDQANDTKAQIAENQQILSHENALMGNYAKWHITMSQLEGARDGAASKLKMFTDSLQNLELNQQSYRADSQIVQLAAVPTMPVRPNKRQNMIFAVVFGLFLGVCTAFGLDLLDDRIKSPDDAARALSLPTIGRIPLLDGSGAGGTRRLAGPLSQDYMSESYRQLRTNLAFASVDQPLRTLAFTSSGIGEGKTTTLANVAIAMAMDGKKVAIIDADLRCPSIHRILDIPRSPGLTDVLAGSIKLRDAWFTPDRVDSLSVLTAGTEAPNPAELLNSDAFRKLLESVKSECDVVLIDGPPMIVADAQVLASRMDGTVLVVEAGRTTKARAKESLERLASARSHVVGMVINKAEIPQTEYQQYSRYSEHVRPRLPSNGSGSDGAESLDSKQPLLIGSQDELT